MYLHLSDGRTGAMTAEIEITYVAELKSIQEEVRKVGTVHSRKHLRRTMENSLHWRYVS